MHIRTYLFFDGRCDEALAFYREALGAEVEALMRFSENSDPQTADCPMPPGWENKVMHASVRIGETTLMASDGRCAQQPDFKGFSLVLNAADEAEADRLFAVLGEGGHVAMPLGKTFFSPRFGMVADRFGVSWMIIVE